MDRLRLALVVPQATTPAPFVELAAELTHVMKSARSDDQLGLIPQVGWCIIVSTVRLLLVSLLTVLVLDTTHTNHTALTMSAQMANQWTCHNLLQP